MAVDRYVSLAAGAHHRGREPGLGGICDVVEIQAVIIADEDMVAAEGQVGVGGAVRSSAWRTGGGGGAGGGAASCGVVPAAKPGGLGKLTTSSMPKAATPASVMPPFSPTRGSSGIWGLLYTVGFGWLTTICAKHAEEATTDSVHARAARRR